MVIQESKSELHALQSRTQVGKSQMQKQESNRREIISEFQKSSSDLEASLNEEGDQLVLIYQAMDQEIKYISMELQETAPRAYENESSRLEHEANLYEL